MNSFVGIDEVGRGCWAGPLVAGAVMLDPSKPIAGLTDSKALSKRRREQLALEIHAQALYVGIGWATPEEVDALGLTSSVTLAMRRALEGITAVYDQIIIDGNYNFLPEMPNVSTMVKADLYVPAVSAASIMAKVARDTYMANLALELPGYGFERHVGYGTAEHRAALAQLGVSREHRRSYKPIKAYLRES